MQPFIIITLKIFFQNFSSWTTNSALLFLIQATITLLLKVSWVRSTALQKMFWINQPRLV